MRSYSLWYKYGAYASNGKCFHIGDANLAAISNFLADVENCSIGADEKFTDNGSLMRLAPVSVYYFDSFEEAVHYAGVSSKTTHQSLEAADSCRYFSALIHGALNGVSKEILLDGLYEAIPGYWDAHPLCPSVKKVALGSYKLKSEGEISSSDRVIDSMEAALWAFYRADDCQSGALAAVNLACDADAVGSIYGQLAGAFFGEARIPIKWILKTRSLQGFYHFAEDLLNARRAVPKNVI
jgi:ADP-ribosylglycohydrolase